MDDSIAVLLCVPLVLPAVIMLAAIIFRVGRGQS
jgi:hypothetical protein